MSAPLIRRFRSSDLAQVEAIFFESSTRKKFADEDERREFQERYLGHYLKSFPELAFVAEGEGKILGYVLGAGHSKDEGLYQLQPHLQVFELYFLEFPAHLHINCHADARGQGVGAKLLVRLIEELQVLKISGLHIMTGPDSRNRSFYQKFGFNFEHSQAYQGKSILLMGLKLTGLVSHP